MKKVSTKSKAAEGLLYTVFLLCGVTAVGFVLCISIYLIVSGIPAIREIGLADFLFGDKWQSTAKEPSFGILPFILTSVYGTAGIPSVVYGLVGMIVLVPAIQKWFSLPSEATMLAAIVVLAIMILPSIINVSTTALEAVPREYEEASMALGATEMETFFKVSVPAAKSGIAASIVLGVGRAIGEAMAIIMVSGNVANMPSLLSSVRFMTTAITSEMSYASVGSLQRDALFSIGLVLFLFIMLINVVLNVFIKGRSSR